MYDVLDQLAIDIRDDVRELIKVARGVEGWGGERLDDMVSLGCGCVAT